MRTLDKKALEAAAEKLRGFPVNPFDALDMTEVIIGTYLAVAQPSTAVPDVERVARAIYYANAPDNDHDPDYPEWKDDNQYLKVNAFHLAKAAIAAMSRTDSDLLKELVETLQAAKKDIQEMSDWYSEGPPPINEDVMVKIDSALAKVKSTRQGEAV